MSAKTGTDKGAPVAAVVPAYFDSALVAKFYVNEPGREGVRRTAVQAGIIVTSGIAVAEVSLEARRTDGSVAPAGPGAVFQTRQVGVPSVSRRPPSRYREGGGVRSRLLERRTPSARLRQHRPEGGKPDVGWRLCGSSSLPPVPRVREKLGRATGQRKCLPSPFESANVS